ncbi:MAG: lytic transglycosylase domain-containing protein [Alphaproteobacteria bacterium]
MLSLPLKPILSLLAGALLLAAHGAAHADTTAAEPSIGAVAQQSAAPEQIEDMAEARSASFVPVPTDKPVFTLAPMQMSFMLPGFNIEPVELGKHRLQVLSDIDAARYRTLFSAARKADWQRLDQIKDSLDDTLLVGHVERLRLLHPTGWRASYDDLSAWMANYADHPGAKRIHELAEARFPGNVRPPEKPDRGRRFSGRIDSYGFSTPSLPVKPGRTSAQKALIEKIRGQYDKALDDGDLAKAQQIVLNSPLKTLLSAAEQDEIRSDLARELFFDGKYLTAYKLATVAALRSGKYVPMSHWTAGLSSWAVKEYRSAALHFQAVTTSSHASPWMRAAGGFWAARAYEKLNDRTNRIANLRRAARYHSTFYGLLAAQALGSKPRFNWSVPGVNEKRLQVLADHPVGRRALALLQVGEGTLAERELLYLHPGRDKPLRNALLAVADAGQMPNLAMRLGSAYDDDRDRRYDRLLFPLPRWQVHGVEKGVDQALILAFMRQESRFNPTAESWSGARGLMQVMPSTAAWLMKKPAYESRLKDELFNPKTSIRIGSKYIGHLLGHRGIDDDLVLAVISYNAGPGNALRWKKQIGNADPLFLIERIPAQETRIFAERVLSNYWIYRMRLGQNTPELNKLARGSRSLYVQQDKTGQTRQVAATR